MYGGFLLSVWRLYVYLLFFGILLDGYGFVYVGIDKVGLVKWRGFGEVFFFCDVYWLYMN